MCSRRETVVDSFAGAHPLAKEQLQGILRLTEEQQTALMSYLELKTHTCRATNHPERIIPEYTADVLQEALRTPLEDEPSCSRMSDCVFQQYGVGDEAAGTYTCVPFSVVTKDVENDTRCLMCVIQCTLATYFTIMENQLELSDGVELQTFCVRIGEHGEFNRVFAHVQAMTSRERAGLISRPFPVIFPAILEPRKSETSDCVYFSLRRVLCDARQTVSHFEVGRSRDVLEFSVRNEHAVFAEVCRTRDGTAFGTSLLRRHNLTTKSSDTSIARAALKEWAHPHNASLLVSILVQRKATDMSKWSAAHLRFPLLQRAVAYPVCAATAMMSHADSRIAKDDSGFLQRIHFERRKYRPSFRRLTPTLQSQLFTTLVCIVCGLLTERGDSSSWLLDNISCAVRLF